MKKTYVHPEVELIKISSLNDFLHLSTEDKATDDWVNDDTANEWE